MRFCCQIECRRQISATLVHLNHPPYLLASGKALCIRFDTCQQNHFLRFIGYKWNLVEIRCERKMQLDWKYIKFMKTEGLIGMQSPVPWWIHTGASLN